MPQVFEQSLFLFIKKSFVLLGQCWKKCFPLFCSYQGTYVAVGISEDDKMGEDLVRDTCKLRNMDQL